MIGFAEVMKVYKPIKDAILESTKDVHGWDFDYVRKKEEVRMDLIKIINCYNPTTQKFKFRRHKAHGISSNVVVQIFGLNNEGIDLSNTDKSTKFNDDDRLIKKYFADVKVVKKKHLAEAYDKAILDETPEGTQNIASLICAHLVQSLLYTNSETYITWSFLKIYTNVHR
ncbi:signal recognition particle subunit SRP68-like [Pyrus ussuriensis x Pyrus communis]|uniref:Signal recognition particle subunit SRP68-like n=1 Tax=Pyrus ussuriensis x Pyrus communis TaxID=2448454 RepID=A0A5N5F831_9ROSA|nr:signal recognition particle subunit SRP68-like [Pyrus ussuriensis x Pyrus communis]